MIKKKPVKPTTEQRLVALEMARKNVERRVKKLTELLTVKKNSVDSPVVQKFWTI